MYLTPHCFLGYDLSHAKILDRKRIGMQSDQTLAAIHKHLRKTLSEQKIKDLVPKECQAQ